MPVRSLPPSVKIDSWWTRDGSFIVKLLEHGRGLGVLQAMEARVAGERVLSVEYIEVLRHREGLGTALYELAQVAACERGLMLASRRYGRNRASGGFWRKQAQLGRAIRLNEDWDAIPCYFQELSAFDASKRSRRWWR